MTTPGGGSALRATRRLALGRQGPGRLILSFEGEAEGADAGSILGDLFQKIPTPGDRAAGEGGLVTESA